MSALVTPPTHDDPKRQTGAYIELHHRLYWVIGSKPGTVLLEVENCSTGFRSHLAVHEVMAAQLVKPAPTLDVPDTIPDATAPAPMTARQALQRIADEQRESD